MDHLVSVREAASRLGCKEGTIRKWIREGLMHKVKLGRLVRIRREDLEAIVRLGLQPSEGHSSQTDKAA